MTFTMLHYLMEFMHKYVLTEAIRCSDKKHTTTAGSPSFVPSFRLKSHPFNAQIDRGWKSRDKRLLFRGWSRLCLHAASLNAAEGASAAATAGARAARAEAMEKEATAANKTAEAWKKAAAASAAAAEAKTAGKEAHSETSRISTLAAGLRERAETSERALQEQKEYRAVLMVRSVHGGNCFVAINVRN